MVVTSTGITNGVIQNQYGGRGTQFNENGIPTYSLPGLCHSQLFQPCFLSGNRSAFRRLSEPVPDRQGKASVQGEAFENL